jgi:hypothetical protein
LAGYGLHWVGGSDPTNASLYPRGPGSLFLQKISDLNGMVESGVSFKAVHGVTRVYDSAVKVSFLKKNLKLTVEKCDRTRIS